MDVENKEGESKNVGLVRINTDHGVIALWRRNEHRDLKGYVKQ